MKFTLPFCLALVTYITPAFAGGVEAKVNIEYADGKSDSITTHPHTGCHDTGEPKTKVNKIDVIQSGDARPKCIFYKDPGCKGDKWTIEVPKSAEDGKKTQKFSRPFYVASLECVKAE
ncbi:hypothetical protein N7533_000394 [Penicillium manginii]|uniref:uncharacterized protein n=1 Tax=Penicillium manginii TaxID=203109 RepID=UPI002547226C|nr:uncharacterized protein N7533_000394 [Penicillium manginii]KAJ5767811.1 hypothetical protein N7533_000394 [Penicillium manginii]